LFSTGTGEWLNLGGNQAVDPLGVTSASQTGNNTYHDSDGAFAARVITPGDGAQWSDDPTKDLYVSPCGRSDRGTDHLFRTTRRWYPSLETIETGRIFSKCFPFPPLSQTLDDLAVLGGNQYGGFVNEYVHN